MSRFVEVDITRETKPVSQKGFGTILMLATNKELPYTVYRELPDVSKDFPEATREYKLANRLFGQSPKVSEIACVGVSYVSGTDDVTALVKALNDTVVTNNDWFYLTCVENGDIEIKALAEWMSSQEKIYGVTTPNIALVQELKGMYENVYFSVHDDLEAFHAEGLLAYGAPQELGSYDFAHKQINGVRAARLSNAELNAVKEANATTAVNEMGLIVNLTGKGCGGDYIDVIQADYFLRARLREDVFQHLATVKKTPFTDPGIAQIVAVADTRFKSAYAQGIIADDENEEPDYYIEFPRRKDIPKNDRSNRILKGIKFRAVIAGAVENVEISGVLTV